ncbi:DNA-binding protein [Bacillus haimaensis]|uniref:DNA-binding protein n=1 Tax=Bacillus haimaensis TaxID=3160967 RepID=UPI003AA82854
MKQESKTIETGFPKGIGKPATRALEAAGYTQLEELTSIREKELLKLHGVGPKAVGILRVALEEKGRSFMS